MRYFSRALICPVLSVLIAQAVQAQPSVLTQDYDIGRSGANLAESILTPSNVSSSTFGKLFSYPVDDEVFAQPLYVPGLIIGGNAHNVVFVATMNNSLYAFDADNAASSTTPLWSVNLGSGVPSSRFLWFAGSGVSRNGIYSTPVIDRAANTIYLITHVWDSAAQSETQQLHALSLTNGQEEFGGPVTITAPGFDPVLNEQRAGLLLLNGVIYVAIASHADFRTNLSTLSQNSYYGMVLAYDAQTLARVAVFNAESGGIGAAIWQGGRGLASDGTYIYAMTANAERVGSGVDYSESFVQLNPGVLSVASYFQDPDAACLNTLDLDLAASGPQVVSGTGTNLLLGGGKEGKVYTLQLDQSLSAQTPEYFWGTTNHPTLPAEGGTCVDTRHAGDGYLQGSDTAFWSNPSGTSYYYSFGSADKLMSWQVAGNTFTQTSVDAPANLYTNALAVSANAGTNGILWTVSNETNGTAVVSAYNAVPSGGHLSLLWNSAQILRRDSLGQLGRYSVPTVANGKVYVGSGSNQVAVYGLLPSTPGVQVTPVAGTMTFTALNSKAEYIFVNSMGGYTGAVTLTLTGLPPGFTYSFTPATVKLTAKTSTVASSLSISPAGGVLPLSDNYTVVVQGNAAVGNSIGYAPMRLLTRSAKFSPVTKVGCNSSNQMDADVTWTINGSSTPALWIQNASTGTAFPGSAWIDPAAQSGTMQTGYTIDNKKSNLLWLFDESAGAPANFDNALRYVNLGFAYRCP